MRDRIYRVFYWLFGIDAVLSGIACLHDLTYCRICGQNPIVTHGACESCYILECEESEEPFE